MSKRKTIQIADLKAKANNVFRVSEDDYADGRRHIQSFVARKKYSERHGCELTDCVAIRVREDA